MITVTDSGVSQVLGYEHIMTQNSLALDYLVICYVVVGLVDESQNIVPSGSYESF